MTTQSIANAKPAEPRIITPAIAKEMLGQNHKNRNLREKTVEKYAIAMRRGDWTLNSSTIAFASDGTLIDGQHRLHACVKAGVPFTTYVITGLDRAAQDTIDRGTARTTGDTLKFYGFKDASNLAALARSVIAAEQSGLKNALNPGTASHVVTDQQVLERVEKDEFMRDCVGRWTKALRPLGYSPRIAALLYYTLGSIDFEAATYFFEKLENPTYLGETDPIYVLRRKLERMRDNRREGDRNNLKLVTALTIKAWNKYRKGEQIKDLRFTFGGANPEVFPKPI